MARVNWIRVFLCGLLAGAVWTLLSLILVAVVGDEFMSAIPRVQSAATTRGVPFALIANFSAGIWAMWLYAAIRPRYGPGPKTAIVAGCAWWFIQSLQSTKWVAVVGVPWTVALGPLAAATLPAMIVAVLVGAWPYEE